MGLESAMPVGDTNALGHPLFFCWKLGRTHQEAASVDRFVRKQLPCVTWVSAPVSNMLPTKQVASKVKSDIVGPCRDWLWLEQTCSQLAQMKLNVPAMGLPAVPSRCWLCCDQLSGFLAGWWPIACRRWA